MAKKLKHFPLCIHYLEEIQFINEKGQNYTEAAIAVLKKINILTKHFSDNNLFPNFNPLKNFLIEDFSFNIGVFNEENAKLYIIV